MNGLEIIRTILQKRWSAIFLAALCCLTGYHCASGGIPSSQLPGSVYFLEGRDQQSQIWKLDLITLEAFQITGEETGIYEFAVSPADGSIAYISNKQLYLWKADREYAWLLVDPSLIDSPPGYDYPAGVANPVFSPDGSVLAYELYGVHFYYLESGQDELMLSSPGNLLGESFVFAKEYYSPGSWSPDGRMIMIEMGYYEGSTLAVMEPGTVQPFRRVRSNGPLCCQFSWSEDSRFILSANPYYTVNPPGLWIYDADSGLETRQVEGLQEDGSLIFIGWPFLHTSGDLTYFRTVIPKPSPEGPVFQNEGVSFKMVIQTEKKGEPRELRQEGLSVLDALWIPDGSSALILLPSEGGRQIVLARTDGSPLQELIQGQHIRSIQWGP